MAYWKLNPSGNTTDTVVASVWDDIRKIIDGSITAVSQLTTTGGWNLGGCYTVGSAPTSGIYSATDSATTSGAANSWYTNVTITKKHYARTQVSGFDPSHGLRMDCGPWTTPYRGLRPTYQDASATLLKPTNSISTRQGWSSDTDSLILGNYPYMHWCEAIHLIINDSTFVWQTQTNDTSINNQDVGTAVLFDTEFSSDVDPYMASSNSNYYSGGFLQTCVLNSLMKASGTGTADYGHSFNIWKGIYKSHAGTWTNSSYQDQGTHPLGLSTGNLNYGMTWPPAASNVHPTHNASGTVHQLVPLMYRGDLIFSPSTGYQDPRILPIRDIYRTSNNLDSGDRLKVGNNYYRVLRMHNCGHATINSMFERACYAFPENNVPY